MLVTLPGSASPRAAYLHELEATIAQTAAIARFTTLPWSLLALNASLYLDAFLTSAAYRSALSAALQRAAAEHQSWTALPGTLPAENELQCLIANEVTRPALYRWLFERAIESRNPAQVLLAQHACEIAEVFDDRLLLPALRLGLIPVPAAALATVDPADHGFVGESIETLSRALLRYRLPARQFAERLLLLHAARRANQLSGLALSATSEESEPPIPPRRLRIVQPHALAERAVASGNALAITLIEAGLVEAEELRGGPRLLLLAALDHALTRLL
jgi:hypothetical protein